MMRTILSAAVLAALLASPAAADEWWAVSTDLAGPYDPVYALSGAPGGRAWASPLITSETNNIFNFDGDRWTVMTSVFHGSGVYGDFYKSFALDENHAWMAGVAGPVGTVFFYNGASWSLLTAMGTELSNFYAADANRLWAAGGAAPAFVYDSTDGGEWWNATTLPVVQYVSGLSGWGSQNLWAMGGDGGGNSYLLWTDGTSAWTIQTAYPGTLNSIYATGPSSAWACGSGNVLHFNGSTWASITDLSGARGNAISAPSDRNVWVGTQSGSIFHWDGATWQLQTTFGRPCYAIDASQPGHVWANGGGTIYHLPWREGRKSYHTDFDGDGTSDIAVYRGSEGRWSVRNVTSVYLGSADDAPFPGDYDGDGTTDFGLFRPNSGSWAVRGLTRVYFGSSDDCPRPDDYDGNGTTDLGLFRPNSGFWAVRDITRVYFGGSDDCPRPGDYDGNGTTDFGLFRPDHGLWAVRNVTRVYFGTSGDSLIPGDYRGDGTWSPGIFRPSSSLWSIRGVTRVFFGAQSDIPVPGDYDGAGSDDIAVFRGSSGLWSVWGVTRAYFGSSGDVPVTR